MRENYFKYDNQGLHVVLSLFTVENGKFKVLLIKRKNQPFQGKWILVGGCAYNNEDAQTAMNREILEKINQKNINFVFNQVYTNPTRSPVKRMIAISYIGFENCKIIEDFKSSTNVSDACWFEIDEIPELGYDHEEILNDSLNSLKTIIFNTQIIKKLMPETFTLPQLQRTYENILNLKLDRRNFRKKLLIEEIIEPESHINEKIKQYHFTDKKVSFTLYK